MTHPPWATKHRKPGTELRCIRGHYYLYETSSRWNAEKKRAQKITGKLLGKITEEKGFVAKSPVITEKSLQHASIKEYGASYFVYQLQTDIAEALKHYFPEDCQAIAAAAFFRLLYQSPLKNMEFHLSQSFLSESINNLSLAPKNISGLLKKLGGQREKIIAFCRSFIQPGTHLLVDVTHMHSYSDYLSMAKSGYNSQRDFDPQVNLLLIFSKQLLSPVYYRLLPGNIRDVKAFQLSLKESGIQDAILIADKGFFSQANLDHLENAQLRYILPLKRNNQLIDYSPLEKSAKKGLQGYFKFSDRHIWYYHYSVNDKILWVFLDDTLKLCEERDYLNRIDTHPEEYTFEQFQNINHQFGTFAILSNVKDSAEAIYASYKSRMDVEIVADTLKNFLHADKTYMRDELALEGWMFINYIALLAYYRIYQYLISHQLLSKYSPKDLLMHLAEIKKIRINQTWHLAEITAKTQKLLQKLDIHIT